LRAVFGEKYPDRVRVVSIGADIDAMLKDPKNPEWMKYSVEFCGGTHLKNTAEALAFTLISEEAVAKGIGRVVGITGEAAMEARSRGEELLSEVKELLESAQQGGTLPSRDRKGAETDRAGRFAQGTGQSVRRGASDEVPLPHGRGSERGPLPHGRGSELSERLSAFQTQLEESVIPVTVRMEIREIVTEVQRLVRDLSKKAASAATDDVLTRAAELLTESQTVGDTHVIVGEVPHAPAEALRSAIDWFRHKTPSSAVLLACHDGEKVTLLAGMSRDVVERGIKAGDLIKEIAPLVGGKGGGRPDMAQGGGGNPSGLSAAIEIAITWINERLG